MDIPKPSPELHDYFNHHLSDYLDLLRRMVLINSFTANPAGVDALGRLTAERFASLGFTAETIASTDARYGRHLLLTRRCCRAISACCAGMCSAQKRWPRWCLNKAT